MENRDTDYKILSAFYVFENFHNEALRNNCN